MTTYKQPFSFFKKDISKSFYCPMCNKKTQPQYGSMSLFKNGTIRRVTLTFNCKDCDNGWVYDLDNYSFITNAIKSIYCGNHSGFKLCCILWHAFVYLPTHAKGNTIFSNLARKYWETIPEGFSHIPCPYCKFTNKKITPISCKNFHSKSVNYSDDYSDDYIEFFYIPKDNWKEIK